MGGVGYWRTGTRLECVHLYWPTSQEMIEVLVTPVHDFLLNGKKTLLLLGLIWNAYKLFITDCSKVVLLLLVSGVSFDAVFT